MTLSETQLQAAVVEHAQRLGWNVMHIGDSRREVRSRGIARLVGDPLTRGWPDLVLVHPGRRVMLIRELKSARGRVTQDQAAWLEALAKCGLDVGVWRPKDWPGVIHGDLVGRPRLREVAA